MEIGDTPIFACRASGTEIELQSAAHSMGYNSGDAASFSATRQSPGRCFLRRRRPAAIPSASFGIFHKAWFKNAGVLPYDELGASGVRTGTSGIAFAGIETAGYALCTIRELDTWDSECAC